MEGDPRVEGRAALREGASGSAVTAVALAGGYVAGCSALGSGLQALQLFNRDILTGMAVGALPVLLIGFVFGELRRLHRCRAALDEVLRAERSYEDLLRDARAERDRAVRDRDTIQTLAAVQTEVLTAIQEVRGRAAPIRTDDALEEADSERSQTPGTKGSR